MKRDLVLAGKYLAGASLTGAIAYLVATAPTHVHVYWPYWVFLASPPNSGQAANPAADGPMA
jgi:hypothetical protein